MRRDQCSVRPPGPINTLKGAAELGWFRIANGRRLPRLEKSPPLFLSRNERVDQCRLRGTGSCVPDRVVPNEWFTSYVDTSEEWIRPDRHPRAAVRRPGKLPARSGSTPPGGRSPPPTWRPKTSTHHLRDGHAGQHVPVERLPDPGGPRLPPVPSFDISAACTASVCDADRRAFIKGYGPACPRRRDGLLSRTLDLTDRNSCILFGDGAGAAILSAADNGHGSGRSCTRTAARAT